MSTKQVQVHADGCTPDTLELMKHEDKVVFIQGDPKAPLTVHVDHHDLFGTSTCSVGSSVAEATVYTAKAVGNYVISLKPAGTGTAAKTVQVLCLAPAKAMGAGGGTGSIKVTG